MSANESTRFNETGHNSSLASANEGPDIEKFICSNLKISQRWPKNLVNMATPTNICYNTQPETVSFWSPWSEHRGCRREGARQEPASVKIVDW